MKHLDLFSGIGGFSLAASRVWPNHEVVGFCEIDPFCQKVLKKHWPDAPIYYDIKKLKGSDFDTVELISGGFPCQPYSVAGKRRGKEDDRALWPEMLRVIQEIHPAWIVGENVSGFIHMGLDDCITDLESEGYEVQSFIIPACAVNAPHRRDRVWIVAHGGIRDKRRGRAGRVVRGQREQEKIQRNVEYAPHPGRIRPPKHEKQTAGIEQCGEDATYTRNQGPQGSEQQAVFRERRGQEGGAVTQCNSAWDEPWIEAASRLCKLHDGISNRLDGCLTYPETHGIMGFILTLRRYHYATSQEERTQEALRILREAFKEKSVQRAFGRLQEVFVTQALRCSVHGKGNGEGKENKIGISKSSVETPEKTLRKMRGNVCIEHPSQRRKLEKQCSCEFDNIVCELSHEVALGEWKKNTQKAHNLLFCLWQESRGQRFLHEPLSALHEIWRSITDKEIGSFRRHIDKRDMDRTARLKALGNAIVPQVAEQIFKAIKDT